MTRQLISTVRQPPLHYLTRSVRRTSGFVLTGKPEVEPREPDGPEVLLKGMSSKKHLALRKRKKYFSCIQPPTILQTFFL